MVFSPWWVCPQASEGQNHIQYQKMVNNTASFKILKSPNVHSLNQIHPTYLIFPSSATTVVGQSQASSTQIKDCNQHEKKKKNS